MPVVQPLLGRLRPWVFVMMTALGPLSAHAALFGDDEARRAILDLRQLRTQDREAHSALSAQVDQLKRSLLEMHGQLEQMRADLARQRGQEELLLRDVAELQRRLKDAQTAQEERLRLLEPQPVTVDGKTFKALTDETRTFDDALAHLRAADFAAGAGGLNKLLQSHPQTGYRESAWYWLGNAHYGLRAYKPAIQAFKQLVDQAPDHARTPEALLSIGNCHLELKDNPSARKVLEQLIKQYPQTEAAQAARDRLLTMPKAK
ncbi:tol-pal system protein YbgF [Aquabacterium sp.]|jgi:tol-pal system protein YbgF|uniref:tol-pal system protein YbgF n=1 Tax=Aquabacterium sp. TaxID=1872578 RepID=UPI0025C6EB1A|nr:tol-pal system protein YbgF [Aquabacterium sp.]MDQ5925078.1 Cell division coordinator CpoB [Pseudomonadota bacterium]